MPGIPNERSRSARKAWVRALERTAAIERNPHITLPLAVDALAGRFEAAPALVSREAALSYRSLSQTANRYARWALSEGLQPGEVVCLLMENCPDYLAIWLGLTRAGLTVALLNTHLSGPSLEHSIRIVAPRGLIFGASLAERVRRLHAQSPGALGSMGLWAHRMEHGDWPCVEPAIAAHSGDPLAAEECPLPSLSDRALLIYTSGTTGLPKAAILSHRRLMQWSHWFAGLMDVTATDRLYDCLPMYHSVGGVVATGATLVGGGTVVLRERFSASRFWQDIREERCTIFQYIGELCRYLLSGHGPPDGEEGGHSLRLACGNGLREEVWQAFQSRFRIPQILEYYAATEGSFSLYNCEGRPGSIGRVPPFLSHRYPVALVRFDTATAMPVRDAQGRCIRCDPGEIGEAVGEIRDGGAGSGADFEGYADPDATRAKVLRDVFAPGDAWYRTGDLMRCDEQGFFYFVDRIGDTFRWKGENVSTTEVAAVLTACRGVRAAAVYGVTVPGTEGRAGMAALVVDAGFDLATFGRESGERLPDYARPLFLRIAPALDLTGTLKVSKQRLIAEGYDPSRVGDPLYLLDSRRGTYLPLDAELYSTVLSPLRSPGCTDPPSGRCR
jgi:fatty-acyl-CoA synthase